jgi:hypothetical protein
MRNKRVKYLAKQERINGKGTIGVKKTTHCERGKNIIFGNGGGGEGKYHFRTKYNPCGKKITSIHKLTHFSSRTLDQRFEQRLKMKFFLRIRKELLNLMGFPCCPKLEYKGNYENPSRGYEDKGKTRTTAKYYTDTARFSKHISVKHKNY